MQTRLVHQDVAELPGIAGVEGFRKQLAAADERRPVGVAADYRTELSRRRSRQRRKSISSTSTMPRSGFSSIHTMPASTADVTCRPVAFWYGASRRVSSTESCEPYQ